MMKKIYNIIIIVLAAVSILFVFLDLFSIIDFSKNPYYIMDMSILCIFAIDYLIRFAISKNRKEFIKENIFDLIAVIPFNTLFSTFRVFRIFRIAKMSKLAKLSRVVRATAFFEIVKKKIKGIINTNGLIYIIYLNSVLIIISSLVMMNAEKMDFGDALWWSIVTCTTVGYGDYSPTSSIGRIFAVLLMLFGITLIGMLTGSITTYFTKQNTKTSPSDVELSELIKQMDEEQKSKLYEIAKIIMK